MTSRRINSIFNDITTLALLTALLFQQLNYSHCFLNVSFFFSFFPAAAKKRHRHESCESLSMNLSCYMTLLEKQFKNENRVKNCATITL